MCNFTVWALRRFVTVICASRSFFSPGRIGWPEAGAADLYAFEFFGDGRRPLVGHACPSSPVLGTLWTARSRRGLAQRIRNSSSLTKCLCGRRQRPIHFGWDRRAAHRAPMWSFFATSVRQIGAGCRQARGPVLSLDCSRSGRVGIGGDELSASAWHGARPSSSCGHWAGLGNLWRVVWLC